MCDEIQRQLTCLSILADQSLDESAQMGKQQQHLPSFARTRSGNTQPMPDAQVLRVAEGLLDLYAPRVEIDDALRRQGVRLVQGRLVTK